MDIYCRVTFQGLVPLYSSDSDQYSRLKQGSVVKCKVANPRNYKHHKKFFALLRLTFDNLPIHLAERWQIHTEEDMLKRFKRDLGHYTSSTNVHGEREIEYKSISFAAMEQYEFEKFYTNAINLVLYRYLKGVDQQDLIQEIENFQ